MTNPAIAIHTGIERHREPAPRLRAAERIVQVDSRVGHATFVRLSMPTLQEQFGQIDIYLFDQILRGRIAPGMRILDAGCGSGRNLIYFLREGYEVYASDADAGAVEYIRTLARTFAPALPLSNFRAELIESMSFSDACADVVISSAVLHFSRDDA